MKLTGNIMTEAEMSTKLNELERKVNTLVHFHTFDSSVKLRSYSLTVEMNCVIKFRIVFR